MPKAVETDPKYHRAKKLLTSLDMILGKADKKMELVGCLRLRALHDLELPFPVVRKLEARLTIRRAIGTKQQLLGDTAAALLQEWDAAADPAHRSNRQYLSQHYDTYANVCQRVVTKPFPIPTGHMKGVCIDLQPATAEKGRLFEYGLDLSDDSMETGSQSSSDFGFSSEAEENQVVPSWGSRSAKSVAPAPVLLYGDAAAVPGSEAMDVEDLDAGSSDFFGSGASTMLCSSRMADFTTNSAGVEDGGDDAGAQNQYSYPMTSTPMHNGAVEFGISDVTLVGYDSKTQ